MTPDPGALDAMTASVPSGELAAFGLAMEGAQKALAALLAENERLNAENGHLKSEMTALGDRIGTVIAHAVADERERIAGLFGEWITILMSEPNAQPPEAWIAGFADLIRPKPDTCGQCDGGLVPVSRCNCGGGGPDGIPAHEPLCGAEPCPNGCWERLHPPLPVPGEGGGK